MKKNATVFYVALAVVLAFTTACNIVEPPYFESVILDDCEVDRTCLDEIPDDPFAEPPVKKVLFEEFTGHRCVSCPKATENAYRLTSETYKDRAFLVCVHATGLAEPIPGSEKYNKDFTTDAGDEYKEFFNILGVPLGLINRQKRSNGKYYFTPDEWESAIGTELSESPEAHLHIATCYDAATRDLKIISDIKYLIEATDQEYFSVWIVEDSVRGWQKDKRRTPQDVENYVFHNILRDAPIGTWGQPLTEGTVVDNGDTFRKAVCYTIPREYDASHCKVLVFVHNFENRSVRQVEAAYVIE